jgi:hypothetical protein
MSECVMKECLYVCVYAYMCVYMRICVYMNTIMCVCRKRCGSNRRLAAADGPHPQTSTRTGGEGTRSRALWRGRSVCVCVCVCRCIACFCIIPYAYTCLSMRICISRKHPQFCYRSSSRASRQPQQTIETYQHCKMHWKSYKGSAKASVLLHAATVRRMLGSRTMFRCEV